MRAERKVLKLSEPRPLSLGDLLRFDRERRSRESSSQIEELTAPPPALPPSSVGDSESTSETNPDMNLASQIHRSIDSQIPKNPDSQIDEKFDSQKPLSNINLDKLSQNKEAEVNTVGDDNANLASQMSVRDDSQIKFLASQKSDFDSQKVPSNDDLAIKIAKSSKKLIAKKVPEKRWTRYERNRDRSGERGEFFCRPRNAILKQAKHLMIEHGLKTHEFFELATTMLGEYLASQKDKPLAILISTDNDRLMKTFICDTRIINLYREVTGNRWTMTDDSVGAKFNDLDFRIVEIAVIRTYIRWMKIPSKKPIKWFKYFKDEIELHAEELKAHSANTIDVMAAQARKLLDLVKQGIDVDA